MEGWVVVDLMWWGVVALVPKFRGWDSSMVSFDERLEVAFAATVWLEGAMGCLPYALGRWDAAQWMLCIII